jgi:tRNA threonylcarbamoyl adenosine modification protein (Sua5/YciO/YrdC/YwlC family)
MDMAALNGATGPDRAAKALAQGHLVVMPTDTVYGVAARPDLPQAIDALFAAKARPRQLALPVLVANLAQAEAAGCLGPAARRLIEAFWPGPLTLVVKTKPGVTWQLGATNDTIALRQPAHPLALELLQLTGPLAVTSANLSGQPPATTAKAAQQQLGQSVAVYLDGGPSGAEVASAVVDLTGKVKILRAGELTAELIVKTAEGTAATP